MAKNIGKAIGKYDFPKTVYVHHDGDDSEVLLADTDIEAIVDGSKVGIYGLKEIKTKATSHALE